MTTSPKRLGELLVGKGLISPAQLDMGLSEQRSTKEFLGAILVRKGWLKEEQLLKTLAEQAGIPYGHLEAAEIDWAVARRFSPSLLLEHHCFPTHMDGQAVVVAIANPLDAWATSALEKEAGFRQVRLMLAPEQEILAAIQQAHRQAVKSLKPPSQGHDDDDTEQTEPTVP